MKTGITLQGEWRPDTGCWFSQGEGFLAKPGLEGIA